MASTHAFYSLFLLSFTLTAFSEFTYYEKPIVRLVKFTKGFDNFKFVSNDNNYTRKCCPPNYKYEKSERKCIKSNGTFIADMVPFLMETNPFIGLPKCEVIVDQILSLDDLKTLFRNTGVIQYKNENFPPNRYCIDAIENNLEEFQVPKGLQKAQDFKNDKAILRVCYESDYCTKTGGLRCLQKCCPDRHILLNGTCVLKPEYGFPIKPYKNIINNLTDNFAVSGFKKECIGPMEYSISNKADIEKHKYCLEFQLTNPNTLADPILMMCDFTHDVDVDIYSITWQTLRITSCIFLVATMTVHVFLYKLKDVRHHIVFCFYLARFTGFAASTYLAIYSYWGQEISYLYSAFVIFFGWHAGFAWLTVMCFDMWSTLGSMVTKFVDNKSIFKRTFYYCLYGLGVPALAIIFRYIDQSYDLISHYLRSNSGDDNDLIEKKVEDYRKLFFILPMLVDAIANVIFIALTVRYIIKVTDSIKNMSDTTNEKDQLFAAKNRTCKALKLFFIMGISWSCETVALLYGMGNIYQINVYIIFETVNCCQGSILDFLMSYSNAKSCDTFITNVGICIFSIFLLKWAPVRSTIVKYKLITATGVDRIKFSREFDRYTIIQNEQ